MFQSRETIALSNEFTNLPVTQTQKHENEPKSCLGVENDSDLVKNNSHHSSGLSNHPTFSESESINVWIQIKINSGGIFLHSFFY